MLSRFTDFTAGAGLGVLLLGGALAAPPAFASDHNVSIHTEDRNEVSRAKEILKRNNAQDITYTGEAGVSHEAHA